MLKAVKSTAIPIIIEGQFQVFQRFASSKLVLKTVESCFVALNYYGNGSTMCQRLSLDLHVVVLHKVGGGAVVNFDHPNQ